MSDPEQKPINNNLRLQTLDEEDRMKAAMESLEKENHTLKDLVVKLSKIVIQRIAGKK